MNLVGGFEDFFICGVSEFKITDVSPNTDWKLVSPQGKNGAGAAAAFQLPGLPTDILNNLGSQLRGQPNHRPRQGFAITIRRLGTIEAHELRLDVFVDAVSGFRHRECQVRLYILFLFIREVAL